MAEQVVPRPDRAGGSPAWIRPPGAPRPESAPAATARVRPPPAGRCRSAAAPWQGWTGGGPAGEAAGRGRSALRLPSERGAPGASGQGAAPLAGKRILVVEDEALLAMKLKDMLEKQGCVVVGPVARLARALALLDGEAIDGAVLDINLAGVPVFPLALELRARGIPFIFATGYEGSVAYPDEVRDAPRVRKPYGDAQLLGALEHALAGRP